MPKKSSDHPSLFVTLGTIEGYGFDSLVEAVLTTGLADDRTVWQIGNATRHPSGLPGRVFTQVSAGDFARYAAQADVVVTHAGVGTLLGLLDCGIYPVLVVRRSARNEHIDDHQAQIAQLADERGIAKAVEVDGLTRDVLCEASGFRIVDAAGV
ncbi:glycosyltransferase [Modestobacter sp. SYSU DS0511]